VKQDQCIFHPALSAIFGNPGLFISGALIIAMAGWLVGMPKTLNFSLQGIDHHKL